MPRGATHPGKVLAEDLAALDMAAWELAEVLQMPPQHLLDIVAAKRPVDADTALRLGHYFDTSPLFWLNLQVLHDLRLARAAAGRQVERLPVLAVTDVR
ncbi:MAG: HigA family addiction module antitoxin [Gammaproteobacteria bacterium]|nr:HigA family addiction module antitoxin [Gammaproteobacteria bacterium]